MKLTRILDLAGTDVAGREADVRSRFPNGELRYSASNEAYRSRRLTKVHIKRENKQKWLRWEWTKDHASDGFDCGFSGIRMDSPEAPTYHILVEDKR